MTEIAVGIARQFDISVELERDLRRAALLHDIGKLGVSNMILDKPGKPTDDEFQQIRKHPDYTQQILKQVERSEDLAEIAAAHHERLDGRGYHRRLDGSELPCSPARRRWPTFARPSRPSGLIAHALPWQQIEEIITCATPAPVSTPIASRPSNAGTTSTHSNPASKPNSTNSTA